MKLITKIVGACLGLALIGSVGIVALNNSVKLTRASAHNITLNINNSPDLNNGEGTQDINGVTWEYYNASENETGHVTIGHQGYAGVASTTDWGYTGIDSITANFTLGSEGNELWLLSSYDGIEWHEQCMLESGTETTMANDWRYVRFYNWAEDAFNAQTNSNINITSIHIGYECSGETSSEDVDGAHIENVITTSNTNAYAETTNVSPLGNSTRAIRFEKVSGSTYAIIGFGREYQLANIKDKRVEFDLYATVNYDKTAQLTYNTSTIGSTINSKDHTSYKVFNLGDYWYHIEIHINALSSMFCSSSQGDTPATNKKINGIKINVGNGIIDNLRIGSVPSSNVTEVGIFNKEFKSKNNNTCKTNDWSKNYWLKISWTGKLHWCQMIIADTSIAEPVTGLEYPFYITPKAVGTTTVTMKLCVGYDRRYVFAVFNLEIYE